ncbi:RNA polymerase sigma factor (plasmid) [Tundrisphaera lichenicola]|uniref:RNA polymerase sigma factor n=1 Tax=Tundrisphaera lichenicola TaxID=2029860 RepID=UPI003EBAF8CE
MRDTCAVKQMTFRANNHDYPQSRSVGRNPHGSEGRSREEETWEPIVNEAIRSYQAYLKILADRSLAPDLKSKADASDFVQETFAEVYREYYRFEGLSDEEFKALLIRMMMNNLKSFTRRYRASMKREVGREVSLTAHGDHAVAGLEIATPAEIPSETISGKEDLQRLEARLNRLPERDRLAVTMRSQEGRTYREIGKRLGCSSVAARKIWLRTVEKLRRDLKVTSD